MIQRGYCARFLLEAIAVGGVGENLERDVAAEARIAGAVDFAHSTRPERGDDFVGAESCAGR
jgi:hypothetical protein